jgi:hypothetical protein
VFRGALVTKEKMYSWGYGGDALCRCCFGRQESIEHLFFQFSFSRRIWKKLMASCLIFDTFVEWSDVANWSIAALKGMGLQVSLCKLCFAATVYHVWKQMNDLCHGNTPRTEEDIVVQITWEVLSKIMAK